MAESDAPITLSCHCGGTRIELPRAPQSATQCTCTYCLRTGAQWAYYDPAEIRVVSATHDAIYSPTTPLHEHHFCAHCGMTTHGISPDYSLEDTAVPERKKAAVNIRLFDDYALFVGVPIETIDGRNLW